MFSQKIVSRLILLPTPTTIQKFKDTFSYPPIKFDPLETLHVTLYKNTSADPEKLAHLEDFDFNGTVPFTVQWFGLWYDADIGVTKASAHCVLPKPMHEKINALNGKPRSLYMTFLHDCPPLSRAVKSFISSVGDTLVAKGDTYEFSEVFHVSEAEYHSSFASKFLHSVQ